MEATDKALLAPVENTTVGKVGPRVIHKLINSLKFLKACGLDGSLNECLRRLPRVPSIHLTHLFKHCLQLPYFSKISERSKGYNITGTRKGPKIHSDLHPGKLFEHVILEIVQKHMEK
jgi:hypothetical protein